MDKEDVKKLRKKKLKEETRELIAKYSADPVEAEKPNIKWDVEQADGSGHTFESQEMANIYGLLLDEKIGNP